MAAKNPMNLPTEKVELLSKGLLYPTDRPASAGEVEIIYPTAVHEDILTNPNLINKGTAVNEFMKALIVTDIDLEELTPGDKDGIMLAMRIIGFGKDYTLPIPNTQGHTVTFDLTTLKENTVDFTKYPKNTNEFTVELSKGNVVKYKIITVKDRRAMEAEEKGMRKIDPNYSAEVTLLLNHSITELNGSTDTMKIKEFVKRMSIADSKKIRADIYKNTPMYIWSAKGIFKDKDGKVIGEEEDLTVPYTADFFWS